MSELRGPGLVFVGEHDCRLEEAVVVPSALGAGAVAIEVEVSVISAGTELAAYTGLDPLTRVPGSWNCYPHRPGYGAVGRIVALGPPAGGDEPRFRLGDRVLAHGRHARYAVVDPSLRPVVPIAEADESRRVVLVRMANVAITALRRSSGVELGATAVVVGLGLVGNFAAQLLKLAGMSVLGLDRDEHRVELAQGVGLSALAVGEGEELEAVESSLGGRVDVAVEATGVPDAFPIAVGLARNDGEVIQLGTPRGPFSFDATAVLVEMHRRGLRVVGAHEALPPLETGPRQVRWSILGDYASLLELLRSGRLRTDGLVSEVAAPEDCQRIYSRLAVREPGLDGVLFDWG